MKLAELTKKVSQIGVEVFSGDLCNAYFVQTCRIEGSPYEFRVGIQEYSSEDNFSSRIEDWLLEEAQLVAPFDETAPAELYGDLELKGTLAEVKEYIYKDLDFPRKRLWIDHLGQTARLDSFMYPRWYIPLMSIDLSVIGLPSYLNKEIISINGCCQSSMVQYAMSHPRIN